MIKWIARRIGRALGALTEAAFDKTNRDLRFCAIQSLGMIGDRRAVPKLNEALEARNNPVEAASSLARLGDARAVEPMIRAAEDPTLRFWMITALGELGNPQALPFLATQGNDPQPVIRETAAEAAWKIFHSFRARSAGRARTHSGLGRSGSGGAWTGGCGAGAPGPFRASRGAPSGRGELGAVSTLCLGGIRLPRFRGGYPVIAPNRRPRTDAIGKDRRPIGATYPTIYDVPHRTSQTRSRYLT